MEGGFWFANSYAEAAGRFLIACDDLREAGHKVENERLEIGMTGPDGEPLCIDVAIVGSLQSSRSCFQAVEFTEWKATLVVRFNWQ